ncbi:MAG: EAL domain-containing protein [Nitrospirota bacterium]
MLVTEPSGTMTHVVSDGEILTAVKRNQILASFQPIVDRDGGIRKAEALLQWEHPRLGRLPARLFIERLLALAPSRSIVQSLCRYLRGLDWPLHLRLAINLEVADLLSTDTVDTVVQLADHLPLEVELSERGPYGDTLLTDIQGSLRRLKEAGCRIALDDFGAGATSLKILEQIPVDGIKLDRHWIQHAPLCQSTEQITKLLIAAAKALNLEITAEGIETSEQAIWSYLVGCTFAQGWFFSRELNWDEFQRQGFTRLKSPAQA